VNYGFTVTGTVTAVPLAGVIVTEHVPAFSEFNVNVSCAVAVVDE
jgi:hypothetical protein